MTGEPISLAERRGRRHPETPDERAERLDHERFPIYDATRRERFGAVLLWVGGACFAIAAFGLIALGVYLLFKP